MLTADALTGTTLTERSAICAEVAGCLPNFATNALHFPSRKPVGVCRLHRNRTGLGQHGQKGLVAAAVDLLANQCAARSNGERFASLHGRGPRRTRRRTRNRQEPHPSHRERRNCPVDAAHPSPAIGHLLITSWMWLECGGPEHEASPQSGCRKCANQRVNRLLPARWPSRQPTLHGSSTVSSTPARQPSGILTRERSQDTHAR